METSAEIFFILAWSEEILLSGFHNNWMKNRCRFVLKRCVNVIGRNAYALAWLTKKTKVIGRAFEMIFVEISGHELRAVWRRSKLKNKVWHSSHKRHIALFKRAHKQVEIRYSFIYQNNTHTLRENSCSFSRDFAHGTRWTSPPLYKCIAWRDRAIFPLIYD